MPSIVAIYFRAENFFKIWALPAYGKKTYRNASKSMKKHLNPNFTTTFGALGPNLRAVAHFNPI